MKNRKQAGIRPEGLFFLLAAGQLLFSVCYLIKTRGNVLHAILSAQGADQFMDFFNHISYVREPGRVYFASPHACFPPLIYLLYFLCSRILPQDATAMYDTQATSTHAQLLYVVYCVALAVLFFYSVCKLLRNRTMEFSLAVTAVVLSSEIFVFGVIQRGNSAMIVCILLLLALDLRESPRNADRELALVWIAVAAGIKIYPAVFGFLYIFEKRWKEALRLLVYGIVCFFVPFLFFGGTEGMAQFFRNQAFVHSMGTGRIGSVKMSWERLLYLLEGRISMLEGWARMGMVLTAAVFLLFFAGACFCREQYLRVMLLAGMMVLVPFWSGGYTQIYMCLPLVLFFRDMDQAQARDRYLYAVLFAMVFAMFIYDCPGLASLCGTGAAMTKSLLAIYVMCAIASFYALVQEAVRRKGK